MIPCAGFDAVKVAEGQEQGAELLEIFEIVA